MTNKTFQCMCAHCSSQMVERHPIKQSPPSFSMKKPIEMYPFAFYCHNFVYLGIPSSMLQLNDMEEMLKGGRSAKLPFTYS